jgi:hypothetical protein
MFDPESVGLGRTAMGLMWKLPGLPRLDAAGAAVPM